MISDEYFMKQALREAEKALKSSEVPVGTIIVLDNKIIARAHNKRHRKRNITRHAELDAIKVASRKLKDWRLNDCVMYVTLSPCPMCASAIVQSRIKKIVIGTKSNDLKNQEITNLILDKKIIEVKENILQKECSDILISFFKKRRNK